MVTTLTYLFDPLCGWCYGASPVIQQLSNQDGVTLKLAPTGLFAGSNGRLMDAGFAEFAWSNDMRIKERTGQRFTDKYRTQVLGNHGSSFDSEIATLALTVVSMTDPQRELETLKVLQEARYVHGQDITDVIVVKKLLNDMGLVAAAMRLAIGDTELRLVNGARLSHSQHLLHTYGITGVPNIVVTNEKGSRLLSSAALFSNVERILGLISK
ncbi:DsbA family protein [Undibacterium sp. Xuan67W]|uniref:DsbA family protein n=1 Tax=Undibacterium sp. Xuan67W TaxID=3413057 RepID=UPI003BEF65EA